MRTRYVTLLAIAFLLGPAGFGHADHRVLMQGEGKLAIVAADGAVEWEMPWGPIHDLHVLPGGNILTQDRMRRVVEIDTIQKKVVWSYDSASAGGNAGRPVEVHAVQPLADGRVMIAESGPGRIIEVDRSGAIVHQVKLKIARPDAHRDTRLVRKIAGGNYLVCHEGEGVVREYHGQTGDVVWEYPVPLFGRARADGHGPEAFGNQAFAALRLAGGSTLIATGNGHGVIEVTPQKEVVWRLDQHDLPGVTLAWVTTLEVLPGGNYVIGNCHAGPDNPLLIEIEPESKRVVWTFDRFDLFGNAASNSQVLDAGPPALR
ncbi:hypothetical protein Pla175_32530 [Pirellulimonas nuda]|uniref:Pyrrolo-quinoline quinone repeat domain-containing protein n=1 Tax=Pirellulimonas nuda TaxID=2528009 RepID=A0A518DEG2_9BACT|nr:PQQ-binding-like beta-propeller repeat protein [Pirellulimonas nuda]QDU89857.1 hypothetical protein Pla175_32530 [Pirellulimonas nuda]